MLIISTSKNFNKKISFRSLASDNKICITGITNPTLKVSRQAVNKVKKKIIMQPNLSF